jgi:hypothetical protein
VISWAVAIVAGAILGVTSYWHGRAGGAGTTGAVFVLAGLATLVVLTAAGVWAGKR